MARLTYQYPIDEVHGRLTKKFGVAQRESANAEGEGRGFSVLYGKRKTAVTTGETTARAKFSAVSKLVAARMQNGTKKAQDMAAYKAQSAKKTLYSYVWSVCKAEYEGSAS